MAPDPWPSTAEELERAQRELALLEPEPLLPEPAPRAVAGCFVCFQRGKQGAGSAGDPGWAAAALFVAGEPAEVAPVHGCAGAPYVPGLLALREGPLLEAALARLRTPPEVLLVNAVGRDHPRRAGLALHLGARLGIPSLGVTHRPLVAQGALPPDEAGARSPLRIGGELVGYWLRTRPGTRPLAVHAGWRTDADTAVAFVLASCRGWRTPQPLREARRAAREARAGERESEGV